MPRSAAIIGKLITLLTFLTAPGLLWAQQPPSLSDRLTTALREPAEAWQLAMIKSDIAWTFHVEEQGPRITSEEFITWIQGNKFRQEQVSVFEEADGRKIRQKSAIAYDGSVFYLANFDGERSLVSKFLGKNTTDGSAMSIEIRLAYLQALGFNAPANVSELVDWQPMSAVLQAAAKGKLISVDESQELVTINAHGSQAGMRSEFSLDANKGYALVSRKDYINDVLVYELNNKKLTRSSKQKIWYPLSSNSRMYHSGKAIVSLDLSLKEVLFQVPRATSFDLEPKTSGSLVADRSDAAASEAEDGQITYKIGASGERLQATARSVAPRSNSWKFFLSAIVVGTIVIVATFWKRK